MNISFNEEFDEDVLARFVNEKDGYEVTIITAPEEVLKEDGPVVNQISEDRITIIFAYEYLEKKLEAAHEKNHEEFGNAAFGIGLAFIISQALEAAENAFNSGR